MEQQFLKLKICGTRDPDNILEVAALPIDFMGFIFYKISPRFVGEGFTIPEGISSSIQRVGVFVNETTEVMAGLSSQHNLDYLQLHGDESVEQVETLHGLGFKIIKAFSVGDNFDFEITKPYQAYCSYFLFDTKGKYYGGNAKTFDWSLLKNYNQETPFILSGGINPDNVNNIEELKGMNLFALDVNSGVEVLPGVKDLKKIKKLVDILKTPV